MSKFVAGHVTVENVIFKIMNYFFLNTDFALKLQGKCLKDNVVALTAHLSVTIKRLTRYKHKAVLAAMLEGHVLQRASLRSCPLPINPLCLSREEGVIFSPLEPKKQKKKKKKKKNNA